MSLCFGKIPNVKIIHLNYWEINKIETTIGLCKNLGIGNIPVDKGTKKENKKAKKPS